MFESEWEEARTYLIPPPKFIHPFPSFSQNMQIKNKLKQVHH